MTFAASTNSTPPVLSQPRDGLLGRLRRAPSCSEIVCSGSSSPDPIPTDVQLVADKVTLPARLADHESKRSLAERHNGHGGQPGIPRPCVIPVVRQRTAPAMRWATAIQSATRMNQRTFSKEPARGLAGSSARGQVLTARSQVLGLLLPDRLIYRYRSNMKPAGTNWQRTLFTIGVGFGVLAVPVDRVSLIFDHSDMRGGSRQGDVAIGRLRQVLELTLVSSALEGPSLRSR
jgi:hypothetical protein